MPRLLLPPLAACVLVATACAVSAADTACSDVRPRSGEGFKLGPSCADVVARGDYGADWVKKSIKELPEGYCQVREWARRRGARCDRPSVVENKGGRRLGPRQHNPRPPSSPHPFLPFTQISCGRCPTCRTLDDTLRANGLASVADAAALSPWGPAFKSPATTLTLLAPTAGLQSADVGRHVLVPPPAWGNATYTSALLAAASEGVQTAGGDTVSVGGGGVVKGAGGTARITRPDVAACKSVVHLIDGVL